jgi:alkylation response protein AidB-like acyl-CoA dehydrogenase
MGQTDVLVKETSGNGEMQIEPYEIDYNKLHGRGAAFLITPLGHGSVFSREQFSEEHRMFEQTAKEFGENRILPVREELNVLNKDLSLEIFREMGKLGFLGVDVEE